MVKVLKKKYLLLTAVLSFSMMAFVGCGNRNNKDANATTSPAAEESMTPEATDNTTHDPNRDGGNALDETGDAARDAVDDTGDAVRDAVDDGGNAINDAADDAGDVLNGNDNTGDDNTGNDNATDNNNSVTSGKKRK